jgi:phospholipid/cholesterol/gamma-HCH transport system permease protein
VSFFDTLGAPLRGLGAFTLFTGRAVAASIRNPPPAQRVLEEAYRIGIKSLPILLVISAFVGTNIAIQGYAAFRPLGGRRLVGMFVALAGVRELAPLVTAAMVAAKAGTEMTSQIGVMRIREQIDALEVMAVNPLAYLVAPRMVGILLVLPALTIVSIFTMVSSGYAVSVLQLGLSGYHYLEFATLATAPVDFLYGVVKALVFGTIVCTVSCYFGFHCKDGPKGVGEATNRAVVVASVVCVCLNYFVSEALYGGVT